MPGPLSIMSSWTRFLRSINEMSIREFFGECLIAFESRLSITVANWILSPFKLIFAKLVRIVIDLDMNSSWCFATVCWISWSNNISSVLLGFSWLKAKLKSSNASTYFVTACRFYAVYRQSQPGQKSMLRRFDPAIMRYSHVWLLTGFQFVWNMLHVFHRAILQ